MSKPTYDGPVRSNFWKGRQRLNRLYRWIANVVRPKIDLIILFQNSPQNNPDGRDFLIAPCQLQAAAPHRHDLVVRRDFGASGAHLRRNWPRGGAPRGAPPPGRSSL